MNVIADVIDHFAHLSFSEGLGYVAAVLVLLTFSMKTMVPLRVAGIASNVVFIAMAGSPLPGRCSSCIWCCCR